jgi:thiol-disulfide isomerase/thioredoxin
MMVRMKRRTLILGACGLSAMVATGWFAWRESSRKAPGANRAASAPSSAAKPQLNPDALLEARLPDMDGREVLFKTYLGKPLVVNFWATWCAPCVEEMPALNEMAQSMPDVQFVGIGIDNVDKMRQFIAKIPVSYPLLVAGHGGIALLRELGNSTGGLPFTVMFDANGSMIDTVLGQVQPADLDDRIRALVVKSKT